MAYINGKKVLFTPKLNIVDKYEEGYEEGYEAGKNKEWSDFWEEYQNTAWSKRTDYKMAFCGSGWNTETFVPKYDLKPTNAERMFQYFGAYKGKQFNLAQHLRNININLDFSNCTYMPYAFAGTLINVLGTIDMSKATDAGSTELCFNTNILTTVEKFVFSENTNFTKTFTSATGLKNINAIEGTIGKTISFADSPLSKSSITRVVNALSSTKTSLACTINKAAKEAAFTEDEWAALIATKTNWTFSLA